MHVALCTWRLLSASIACWIFGRQHENALVPGLRKCQSASEMDAGSSSGPPSGASSASHSGSLPDKAAQLAEQLQRGNTINRITAARRLQRLAASRPQVCLFTVRLQSQFEPGVAQLAVAACSSTANLCICTGVIWGPGF